jgi:hypothetical protein
VGRLELKENAAKAGEPRGEPEATYYQTISKKPAITEDPGAHWRIGNIHSRYRNFRTPVFFS